MTDEAPCDHLSADDIPKHHDPFLDELCDLFVFMPPKGQLKLEAVAMPTVSECQACTWCDSAISLSTASLDLTFATHDTKLV